MPSGHRGSTARNPSSGRILVQETVAPVGCTSNPTAQGCKVSIRTEFSLRPHLRAVKNRTTSRHRRHPTTWVFQALLAPGDAQPGRLPPGAGYERDRGRRGPVCVPRCRLCNQSLRHTKVHSHLKKMRTEPCSVLPNWSRSARKTGLRSTRREHLAVEPRLPSLT
jgi:hypothetical protein